MDEPGKARPALTDGDVIACLIAGRPRIQGPEGLGQPGLGDIVNAKRLFAATIWDPGFVAAAPGTQLDVLAGLFEKDPGLADWFHAQVASHGTAALLLLAVTLRTDPGERPVRRSPRSPV